MTMFASQPTSPAVQAYRVYQLSQIKLDRECRRQKPDLHRIVGHASIVDSVRRWSREHAEPADTLVVDDSDADSDPFEDSSSDDDADDATEIGQVAIFDCEAAAAAAATAVHHPKHPDQQITVHHVEDKACEATKPSHPQRTPPSTPPASVSVYTYSSYTASKPRLVTIRERALDADDDWE